MALEEEREEGRSESRVQSSTCLPVGLRGVEKGVNPEFRVQGGHLGLRRRKRGWGSSLSDFPEEGLRELMNSEFRMVSVQCPPEDNSVTVSAQATGCSRERLSRRRVV